VNLLFVNYGDFTSNSLNHIAAFARELTARGHSCVVAVPRDRESVRVIPDPAFIPASYAELLSGSVQFPDGRPADLIHAWTPREGVREFVLAYQPQARAPLVVHLEDNELFLTAQWLEIPEAEAARAPARSLRQALPSALSHPRRHRAFLEVSDACTCIVDTLQQQVPPGIPTLMLPPGVDPSLYHPQPADADLRREYGIDSGHRLIVFTGSNTFVNEAEVRELYQAVALLNERGQPTTLLRTGLNPPAFAAKLTPRERKHVIDLGFVDKALLPRLLALADVLVQPGRPGPFNDFRLPSKLPEFLSMGLPVVLPAANVGRQLRDGQDALLLQRGGPEEIADACGRVFADPAFARELGRNAAAFARRHFDLKEIVDRLEAFYAEQRKRQPTAANTRDLAPGTGEVSLLSRRLADSGDSPAARELSALIEDLEIEFSGERERTAALARELERSHGRQTELQQQRSELVSEMQRQRIELDRRIQKLDEQLRVAREKLDAETERVRRMRQSFSWQVTQPLRFLRRLLLDPRRRGTATESPSPDPRTRRAAARPATGPQLSLWHCIDFPRGWNLSPRICSLHGWCFDENGAALDGVRAVLADRTVEGTYGLSRPDVSAATRNHPQSKLSGWKIDLDFREGDERLDLEVRDRSGQWHAFFHTPLRVGPGLEFLDADEYARWIERFDQPTPARLQAQSAEARGWHQAPRLSILIPVYNTPEQWLRRAIESVRRQSLPDWELCLADDASTAPHVRPLLEHYAREDGRIRVTFRRENGHISAASNSALELATGEFLVLLDHDDELAPHALFEVARLLRRHPDTDYIYSDDDKIDEQGRRHAPYFKPDYLPDLFTAQNYLSHLSVYRASLVREVGGFRVGYEGSQDWDLALRVIERSQPERVRHIPKVLYHWRAIPGSTALQIGEKNYAVTAAGRALQDHFDRLGQKVRLHPVTGDHWRVEYPLPDPPPLVTLIMPTRNGLVHLQRCVQSILERSTYPAFELLVIDNGSDDPAALEYLSRLASAPSEGAAGDRAVRVIHHDAPFNYSALNNLGVREARGEVVALVNNDLEVITPGWLEELVSQAMRPGIGCVGPLLYYPDDTIQQAGTVLGIGGVAGHAFRYFARGSDGMLNRARLAQNYSAVTGACLVVRRKIYEEVGGLDETSLAVAFNDVDFCLKVRQAGYRNLWTPFAELYHHESATRNHDLGDSELERFQREIATMRERWGAELDADPAYNPNLSLESNDFALAVPPREWEPWNK